MARTYRNLEGMNHCALRFPKTYNEIRNLNGIIENEDLEDFTLSKHNRISSRSHGLPTAWDDVVVSGYYETDYKTPYKYS